MLLNNQESRVNTWISDTATDLTSFAVKFWMNDSADDDPR